MRDIIDTVMQITEDIAMLVLNIFGSVIIILAAIFLTYLVLDLIN